MLTGISGSKTVFSASTIPSSTSVGSNGVSEGAGVSTVVSAVAVSVGSDMGKLLLGGDGMVLLVERGLERMPGESGALDPHRVLADTGEDGELAQSLGVRRGLLGEE